MHARSPSQRRSGTSGTAGERGRAQRAEPGTSAQPRRAAKPRSTRRTAKPRQLTLDHARRPTGRGGWRPGAGRPRSPGSVSHRARAAFASRFPQHVTWRTAPGVPSLRRGSTAAVIRRAVSAARRADFAVVELNILSNHVHMLVEADGADALSRGMHGLGVRLARRINAHLDRSGNVFERYHARSLCTPREVRNALETL
jgi:REP element-mobilizing transposase RayT